MVPRFAAVLSVLALLPLLVWHVSPASFPAGAHDLLGSIPLALVGVACVLYPLWRRARVVEVAKASIAALAFFVWAANQYWPDHPKALLMNDIAIALFVIDVVLVVLGWPVAPAPAGKPATR